MVSCPRTALSSGYLASSAAIVSLNGSTFEPRGGRWYLGGPSRLSAAATVSRAIPSRRATARWDKPSTRCSRRTSAHVSTGSTPHSWPTPDQDQLDSAGGRLFSRWFWQGFYPLATPIQAAPH